MNINSSLPIIRSAFADSAATGRGARLDNEKAANQSSTNPNNNSNPSLSTNREITQTNFGELSDKRSERIDLRVLRVEAESLTNRRALASYQTIADISVATSSSPTARLDLFV